MSLWYNPSFYISPRCQAQQGWDGGDKSGGIWGDRKDAWEDRLEDVHRSTLILQGNSRPTNLTTLLKNYQWLFGTSQMNRAKLRVTGPPLACPKSPPPSYLALYGPAVPNHTVFPKDILASFIHLLIHKTLHRALLYARLETGLSYELSEGRMELCFIHHCSPGGYTVPPTNYKLRKSCQIHACSLNKYLLNT